MSLAHLLSRPPASAVKSRLARARAVLGGVDDDGKKVSPSMFDPGIISFAHGEGMRRPHPAAIGAGVRALLDTRNHALENYKFLQKPEALYDQIARDFMAQGIDAETAQTICDDAGTSRLFCGFFHATANPGDIFLTAQNYYHTLVNWCDIHGARLEPVTTSRRNDFKMTAHDVETWLRGHPEALRNRRVKGLIIFNPTINGAIYTRAELSALADCLAEYDLLALVDSVFVQYRVQRPHGPATGRIRRRARPHIHGQ